MEIPCRRYRGGVAEIIADPRNGRQCQLDLTRDLESSGQIGGMDRGLE